MRKISSGLAAAAAMLATVGTADAAGPCVGRSPAGVYVLTTTTPSVCVLKLNTRGRITESRCQDPAFEVSLGSLEGTIAIAKSCRVTGEVTQVFDDGATRVDFTLQARGTLVDGLLKAEGTARSGDQRLRIEAAQQW